LSRELDEQSLSDFNLIHTLATAFSSLKRPE